MGKKCDEIGENGRTINSQYDSGKNGVPERQERWTLLEGGL